MATPANRLPTDMGNSGSVSSERFRVVDWQKPGKKVRFIHRNKLVTGRVVQQENDMLHIRWYDVVVFRQVTSVLRPK